MGSYLSFMGIYSNEELVNTIGYFIYNYAIVGGRQASDYMFGY